MFGGVGIVLIMKKEKSFFVERQKSIFQFLLRSLGNVDEVESDSGICKKYIRV